MRSKFHWLLPWWFIFADSSGCANSGSCMRNTDCESDARCVKGTCVVPPKESAGAAGTSGTTPGDLGGSTSGGTETTGGRATTSVTSGAGGKAGAGGASNSGGITSATSGTAGTAGGGVAGTTT